MKKLILESPRGVTLIELMIVVAIVGILAAIGSVAYRKYIVNGKIQRLKEYAQEVAKGEEEYKARNNLYYTPPACYDPASKKKTWTNILEFDKNIEPTITICAEGEPGGTGCKTTACTSLPASVKPDTTKAWYTVIVKQNFNTKISAETTVVMNNTLPAPVVLNEGD